MAKLYYYYSTMNAGKTTTLLQSSYNYRERGMETLLFTPQIDDRYGEGKIQSRIGLSADAITIDADFNLFDYTATQQHVLGDKLACVLIDEAQFLLKHQVQQLTAITTELDVPVLCYGIRTDFLAEPFEGSLYLLAWAEELIEIKTICHCGRKATMNIRVDENLQPVTEGAQIEIGGNDRYITTCLKHFKAGIITSD